ncbi:unnamed protein product [Didymodactylos carnosus]|uniref:Tetraspanin n=1 Tax=Didymodactylos carnosus TaxID=1234261 RepID=A0A814BSG6_9BILA|nr:unnamed protein product [Didymodactylos carnosus]CAF1245425.1 unnamed protein product [Didymodactylos carnosus]CAF3709960.1 unnamed protein product [Didymodactylos carnosus]CAF4053002.1 unnamed protein product [Didymodactylos carnosus]
MAFGSGRSSMSCGIRLIQIIMVVFNVLFFLVGAALLALGIYVMVDPKFQKIKALLPINTNNSYLDQGFSYITMIAIVVVVLGSILFILGFCGCCGAMRRSICLLTVYSILVGIIIIVEVALTIYIVSFQSKFKEQFVPKLQESISKGYQGPPIKENEPGAVSLAWDFIMYNLKCCGAHNSTDFRNTPKWNKINPWIPEQSFKYPLTCCPMGNAWTQDWTTLSEETLMKAQQCAVDGTDVYQTGCYDKLLDIIVSHKLYIIIGAVAVLVIEVS